MLRILFLSLFLFSIRTWSFPEMIRHGYTSCNACHVSPRGGGALTDYGRAMSKEILSTWSYEGEEQWHYGALNGVHPQWLKVGGDFRGVQVHTEDERATVGRFIRMQEQIELVGAIENSFVSVTASSDTLKKSRPWSISGFYISSTFYEKIHGRIGRFVPRFGINNSEHVFSTRGPLGFGIQSERDTLELTYFSEKWDFSFSGVTGRLHNKEEASAIYSQANYSFTNKDKIGLSLEKKFKEDKDFSIGLHGLVGFSEKLYLISESVWRVSQRLLGGELKGIYHFAKIGYEIEKGLHVFIIEDNRKVDLDLQRSTESLYGLGFSFFPRPHFELQGVFSKKRNLARSSKEGDYAWLLMHFYL